MSTNGNGKGPTIIAQVRDFMRANDGREVEAHEVLGLGLSEMATYGALSAMTRSGEITRVRVGTYKNGGTKKKKTNDKQSSEKQQQQKDPEAAALTREFRRKSSIDKRLAEMVAIGFPDGVKPEKISTFLQWTDMTRSLLG